MAEKMVDYLPCEISREIKHFGEIVIDGINEFTRDKEEKPQQKQSKEFENIPIE